MSCLEHFTGRIGARTGLKDHCRVTNNGRLFKNNGQTFNCLKEDIVGTYKLPGHYFHDLPYILNNKLLQKSAFVMNLIFDTYTDHGHLAYPIYENRSTVLSNYHASVIGMCSRMVGI